jgi:lipoprotein-anchoring transpeptidase ErfK/SrfK
LQLNSVMTHAFTLAVALAGSLALTTAQSPARPGQASKTLPAGDTLTLQVALDRAGFSPGEIDGRPGKNTERALAAFRAARTVAPGTGLDDGVRAALGEHLVEPVVEYTVTDADLAGPFAEAIPADLMEQAALKALAYTSAWEQLGERFHASPKLLQSLNPGPLTPGTRIRVPNVHPLEAPERTGVREQPAGAALPVARIVVTARDGGLVARDAQDKVVFYAPVTVGGAQDPLPTGRWKVVEIFDRPVFNYNPDLFWDADPSHAKARIAPGPNNPVGLIWIDLDLENYGIHGTPEPSRIGKSQSHGCVRLTNWDVVRLAALVAKDTPVIFE